MKYRVDIVRIRENKITLNGWVVGKNPMSEVSYEVFDKNNNPIKFNMVSTRRDDVSRIYFHEVYDKDFGFDIQFEYIRGEDYYLVIKCENRTRKIKYNEELIGKRASVAHKRLEKLKDLCNMETVRVAMDYLKKHGIKALIRKSRNKIKGIDSDYEYAEWYEKTKPTSEELLSQREHKFDYSPLFSIVIPVFETPDNFLKELLESLLNQTYQNFEVCIADASRKGNEKTNILNEYSKKDKRIRFETLHENLGISENTNRAISLAKGDFIVLCDHDDVVPQNALFECAKAINENPLCDCLY